jgi:hypothetical protein
VPPVRVMVSVIVTVVVPVALGLGGLKEQLEFPKVTKLEHVNAIVPLVGPRKSRLIIPEDCPEATVKVN